MHFTEIEIASQPDIWSRVLGALGELRGPLPAVGRRAAFIGCGTSFYISEAIAWLREDVGAGESDAFVASELPTHRSYDAVVAISRSGTTTEVVRALRALSGELPTVAITAVADSPVAAAADAAIELPFADERSVVQTRFATAALTLMRAALGQDLKPAIAQAAAALQAPLGVEVRDHEHYVFLGHRWTIGLADEAALKFREASLAHTESYFAGEYRHGPISVAGPGSLVWLLGVDDNALVADIEATGATVRVGAGDPMAELVEVQRAAIALAAVRGLDPDNPQHLTRSVVLP